MERGKLGLWFRFFFFFVVVVVGGQGFQDRGAFKGLGLWGVHSILLRFLALRSIPN